jgi:hypothetical protein
MKNEERPTGIIRTLPSLKDDTVGHNRYTRSIEAIEHGHDVTIYIALQSIPKQEVLHMYLLIEGKIEVRLNIAQYVDGDERECWDRSIRKPKYWAVCTGPVSRPTEPIARKGFQGFRYTADLW